MESKDQGRSFRKTATLGKHKSQTSITCLNLPLCCIRVGIFMLLGLLTSCGKVNSNNDPHFDENGYLIKDTTLNLFTLKCPQEVKFFMEVSGSMNGFFRANRPTAFKSDVWNVLSTFSPIASEVNILTNDGSQGMTLPMEKFKSMMNSGAFVSTASTQVPLMLQTLIDNIDLESNEVGVLISDMKYSPVGSAAPKVLMTQYSTDINRILGEFGNAISIVCASSEYLDREGHTLSGRSPYYFVILGKQEHVAAMREKISLLLDQRGHYVENIESGFIFGQAPYSFGISNKCSQLENEPTFVGYEEAANGDTCTIKLKINLENFRWLLTDKDTFAEAFSIKALYGSQCEVSDIDITFLQISGDEKYLKRKAEALVSLKVFDMPTESEVLEWNLDLLSTHFGNLSEFTEGALEENDPDKSYSFDDFLKGVFQGGLVVRDLRPNYILVSKNE